MTGNKYEAALTEVRSVLDEWIVFPSETSYDRMAQAIVDRLIAKGVIQSTDPDDLRQHRTGPLEPGRKRVGGDTQ